MPLTTPNTAPAVRQVQSHDRTELDALSWPVATGTLNFPAVTSLGPVRELGQPEWARTFTEIAHAGFDHVEITDTWLRPGELTALELDALARSARDAGLRVAAVALIRGSVIAAEGGETNLRYSHDSLEAAAALGAPVVSVGLHEPLHPAQRDVLWFWTRPGAGNDPTDADLWRRAVDRLRELGRHAADLGLLLSLEMYEDTFLGTAASAVRLVEEIGMPNVGLNPDTGNLIRLHRPIEPWAEVLATVLPYTNYWHVKNYMRDEDPDTGHVVAMPTSLELGLIDYRWAVREAVGAGFAGLLTCEQYGGDGLSVSASNREYLRSVLHPALRGGPR
ncbi:sugar phosphate isomerase/epimerase family protein [Pseudonocardia spinosispora]|uniref:sugar phosphate isomerase/epimerase family protein n=1 Tax=Pseudonocardia spinosispora TaxID=103441 RepID=UPI00040EB037|nr:sugar phosphate isomerase/epimerase family protein [Pseudonocardia spinosispora]